MRTGHAQRLHRRYHEQLRHYGYHADAGQEAVVEALARLSEEIMKDESAGLLGWLRRPPTPQGVYIQGGVGRGKTWLMDLFHDCLPMLDKRRVHFQAFMKDIHDNLAGLPRSPDPLKVVARRIAGQTRVLCLDEFHVDDIADAMILSGLLDALFRHRVVLVASSNIPIDELYRDGLQRERFLVAIGLLHRHMREIRMCDGPDYRKASPERSQAVFLLSQCDSRDLLETRLRQLAGPSIRRDVEITLNRHRLRARAVAEGLAWFGFDSLCAGWHSAADYVELAQRFHTVFIERVPVMTDEHDSEARRFIDLVDALYDNRVRVLMTAEAPPDALYRGRRLAFAFERTSSRLHAMGRLAYLRHPHRPQPADQEIPV